MIKSLCFLFLILCLRSTVCEEVLPPPCESNIYCHGPLLHTIQMAKIYQDSKTFVDMKLRNAPNVTLNRFKEFMEKYEQKPTKVQVKTFVQENFEQEGQEFEDWIPGDWIENPKFANKIEDPGLRQWALDLNDVWKKLGRKMKQDVLDNKDLYSIIWIPHPVIVPGGRFREFYYWDTYWIFQGLLLSEMTTTVKGILENFLFIVSNYGHIPNGGRVYYLARSQPPLLTPMVQEYYEATQDLQFIKDNIDTMESEFDYWMTNHTTVVLYNDKNYTLALYGDRSHGPRPESYSEDIESGAIFNDGKKEAFYSELKAAAESGWDFSSRWFVTNATNKGNLTSLKTRSIVPVDLNAIMYWNAVLLADFNVLLNRTDRVEYYTNIAKEFLEAVTAVLWHEEVGVWLDYDLSNSVKRDYFYPTNLAPFWTGCYNKTTKDKTVRLVLKYLQNKHIMNNPGGIPTSMEHTGEQWDYPNAWPPLQHMMIVALNNTGDESACRLAFEIAQKWVRSNYKAFNETYLMFEKYDVTKLGGTGTGGEYYVQDGFGWTNGIIMYLLDRYSDVMRIEDPIPEAIKGIAPPSSSGASAVLLAIMVSFTAGFIGICIYKRRSAQQYSQSPTSKSGNSRIKYTELRNIPKFGNNAR